MRKQNFIILFFLLVSGSLIIRLATLNQMGRTWDEGPYVEEGHQLIELFKKGNFNDERWYSNPDHPPLARYTYGTVVNLNIKTLENKIIFNYDYTTPRLISIFLSTLTIMLVVIIGRKYFSERIGLLSGLILSLLPLSIGYSQLATLESFMIFFFTATIYSFLHLLEKPNTKKQIITGIILGLALLTKQTNALLIPLLFLILLLWNYFLKQKKSVWLYVNILGIGFITFFILWPMPWFNLDQVIKFHNGMWLPTKPLPPPELIFGVFKYAPKYYFLLAFMITTPLIILILSFIGGTKIIFEKKLYGIIILIWFIFPFFQSIYHIRQHNIRYIIEIYAPLSIIAAIGFDLILSRLEKSTKLKLILTLSLVILLLLTSIKSSPYYLTYFNSLVGGTKNVYDEKSFLIGWWGEGMKETGQYIEKYAPKNSSIGVAISPYKVFPPLPSHKVEKYKAEKVYDYVVVSYFNVLREGFDDSKIKKNYSYIHSVKADGANLVDIYQKK